MRKNLALKIVTLFKRGVNFSILKKISIGSLITVMTLLLTLLPFLGIQNKDHLIRLFQSEESYVQERIDALKINSEQRNLEEILGNSY